MLVHYNLQSDKSKEFNGFKVIASNQELTVGDIKQQFPVKGTYYMRFKTILQDENPPIAVWLDGLDDQAPVPTFKDQILIKVLPLPPFNPLQPPRKIYKNSQSRPEASHIEPKTFQRKQSDLLMEFSSHPKHPERSHSAMPNLDSSIPNSHKKNNFDPMGEFLSSQPKLATEYKPKPFIDPTNGLNTEQLKKRAEDRINLSVNQKTEDVKKMWQNEANVRNDKVDAEKEFGEKLNNWESRNHQKNNIRALLATMHNVLWKDSGWDPIGPGELIANAQVKNAYFKSLNIIHPDKHQNDSASIQYISERIFAAVNEAFKLFRNTR